MDFYCFCGSCPLPTYTFVIMAVVGMAFVTPLITDVRATLAGKATTAANEPAPLDIHGLAIQQQLTR